MMQKQTNLHYGSNNSFIYRFFDIFFIVGSLFFMTIIHNVEFDRDYFLLLSCMLLVYSYMAESFSLYRSWRLARFSKLFFLSLSVITASFLILAVVSFFFKYSEHYSRVVVFGWYCLSVFLLVNFRYLIRQIKRFRRRKGLNLQTVAIVGFTESGRQLFDQINQQDELGFKLIGFYEDREPERFNGYDTELIKGSIADAVNLAKSGQINKLYICLPMVAEKRIADIILQLGDTTVDVLLIPDFLLKNLMQARIGNVGSVDTISVFESPMNGMKHFYKRTFDIFFSFTALIFLTPLLIIISLAIKLNSAGPVIFKQDRYGLDGRKIKVWKFRSMSVTENNHIVKQATKGDIRITSVGAFLRKTSLDELPQFFNVFLGDMSVVGPRPHAVAHNEEYRNLVSYYMLRHKVSPGITGWAQINGWRGETDTLDKMEKRIEFDLAYIRNWSLWWDIKIVVMTVFKGFVGKNVY